MKPLLTIAVPTYNRIDALKECLDRILNQIDENNIEVIVSDNASNDGTSEYIKSLQEQGMEIQYYRNKDNIGADRNFLNCFQKANGKYIWLVGDDDFLLPGAVKAVIQSLYSNPCFLHLNSCSLENRTRMQYGKPRFSFPNNRVFYDKNDFLTVVGVYITFISTLIFRTEYINEVDSKKDFINTFFLQSFLAFETMKHIGPYTIVSHNCLAASPNLTVGYDLYYVWFSQYRRLLNHAIQSGFDNTIIYKIYDTSVRNTILEFVRIYRISCGRRSLLWDKKNIKSTVSDLPDLKSRIYFIVYCPTFILKVYQLLADISRPFRRILKSLGTKNDK